MTECQGCGAWNDTSRTLCVVCGTPLAEIDEWDAAAELPPLPPLPDGGLHASMPSWLREPPAPIIAEAPSLAPVDHEVAAEQVAELAPLGPPPIPAHFSVTTTSRDGCAISPCGARRRCAAPLSPQARARTPGPCRPP